jgi:hypothetical protein
MTDSYLSSRLVFVHFLIVVRNKMEQDICIYFLSRLCQRESQLQSPMAPLNNKQRYKQYKRCQSQLLIGLNTDAVSGWLLLASFFYVHKRYKESMFVSEYALSKGTDERLYALNINLYFSCYLLYIVNNSCKMYCHQYESNKDT